MTIDPTNPRATLQLAAFARSLGADVRAAVVSCDDAGVPNGGEGGGTMVLVTTLNPHGLNPGDAVVLSGCGPYDGRREVETSGLENPCEFYVLDTPFAGAAGGGWWSPDEVA